MYQPDHGAQLLHQILLFLSIRVFWLPIYIHINIYLPASIYHLSIYLYLSIKTCIYTSIGSVPLEDLNEFRIIVNHLSLAHCLFEYTLLKRMAIKDRLLNQFDDRKIFQPHLSRMLTPPQKK